MLLVTAALALGWANSPWGEGYAHLWHHTFTLFGFERSVEWVVNDGLMVIFFFVVGLEIRRELAHGELSELKRAMLPAGAALGGMLVPACVYLLFAGAPGTRSGWGVPTATDIAFAVGVLALLGKRVPPALRVLLLALAVIDDLGAIVVIGLFYSSGIAVSGLAIAAAGLAGIVVMQRLSVRAVLAYVVPGLVVWAGIASSGIHPTIAGVLVGLATPVRPFSDAPPDAHSVAEQLIERLHPWVAYAIMPLFALANAGVVVGGFAPTTEGVLVALGVAAGLVLGKPVGVLLACAAMLKLRVATLPAGLTWKHLGVLGAVAGIGFTMALFVAALAFTDPALLSAAKVGILSATAMAAVLGLALGRAVLPLAEERGAAQSADESESSTAK